MQAIILAAGRGSRISEETNNKNKCMIRIGKETIIERLLRQLDSRGLSRIIIVTGYMQESFVKYINELNINTPVVFINNPIFDSTNNIYSLGLCNNQLKEDDTMLFESDLVVDDEIIDKLFTEREDNIAVIDEYKPFMDGSTVDLQGHYINAFYVGGQKKNIAFGRFKTVNIYKFNRVFLDEFLVDRLQNHINNNDVNIYYEKVLSEIVCEQNTIQIYALKVSGLRWYEIDTIDDLNNARRIFE